MAAVAQAPDEGPTIEAVSPTNKTAMPADAIERSIGQMNNGFASIESRADPDAQTTVTDFLDFTEYLPSDVVRSLSLIGKLDEAYTDASLKVDELTSRWGRLPGFPPDERPSPVQLRADISEHLDRAINSRVYAHSEAVRMSDNVQRHYHKAKGLLSKLQAMMDNYPTEDAKSPAPPKSPQTVRAKPAVKTEGGQKVRRPQHPRIIVPGEVLAPHDLDYETFSDESDVSSDEESDTPVPVRRTPAPPHRVKVGNKTQKTPSRLARPVSYPSAALSAAAAANAAALLNPPPEDAVIGSPDAPWLRLTDYELARLRKRMKKNATWTPSETMIARVLKDLNRGPDAFKEAKKKAEDEGKVFEPTVPAPVVDDSTGLQQLPVGALGVETLAADEVPTSNRGMKLNEAKKLKRDALAKQAAEEAEEAARKMADQAKEILGNGHPRAGAQNGSQESPTKGGKQRTTSRSMKRKREAEEEAEPESKEPPEMLTPRPHNKRSKTETPVPPPQHPSLNSSKVPTPENTVATPHPPSGETSVVAHSETPVPIPVPPQSLSINAAGIVATSPTPSNSNVNIVTTTSIPVKLPAAETPVPLPMSERRKSSTPSLPMRESTTKRETRGDAKRTQQQQNGASATHPQMGQPAAEPLIKQSSSPSRAVTPGTTPGPPETGLARRPGSRGKAASQEPQPSLAADRPRRASTARNTPAPEPRPVKRTKRPAPGIVSTTSSGGNSAVGKRKAAPRRKTLARKDKGPVQMEMEEVDDEGNPIDPDEPRYCMCNRVSFGTMIQCDNVDVREPPETRAPAADQAPRVAAITQRPVELTSKQNCKQEWFHLECVGLSDIPARTTKWYCPDCRVHLDIGEKGEVSARGVRM